MRDHAGRTESWRRLAAAMTRDAGIPVETHLHVSAPRECVPEDVLDALVGAARESLRNVARHAGVGRAELVLHATSRGIGVEVTDQGRGLPAEAPHGYGLSESVLRRMEQVGGSAEIGPGRNGAGTRVRLRWHASEETHDDRIRRAYALTMTSTGGVSILAVVAGPMLAAQVTVAGSVMLSTAGYWTAHQWATPGVVAALVAATMVARGQLERGAPSLLGLTGWGLAMAVTTATGLWVAGPGAMATLESFVVGFACLPLLFFACVAPVRYAPLLIIPVFAVVALATALDPQVEVLDALGCFTPAVLGPGAAAGTGALMRRSAAQTEGQRARVVRAHREAQQVEYLARARSQYLHHTEERILPWLEEVASGGADCTSAAARERARLLGLEARDDLYAPGFFAGELRELVTEYRRGGGEVVVRSGVAPGASERTSGRVLRGLVETLPPSYRLTISALPGTDELRLAVVPALPAAVRAQVAGLPPRAFITGDEFVTVVRFPDVPLSGDPRAVTEQV